MKLKLKPKLQNKEINNLKKENIFLKVSIFLLFVLICNLCIEIWKMEFANNKKEYFSKMILKEDESKEFMSIYFIKIEENNK